jgi:protein tyrosine/serine phosphatase
VLLVGVLLAAPSAAQSDRSKTPITVDNFGRVNENYYRGAQPTGRDYANLAAMGIRTVIDLTRDGDPNEPNLVRSAGMTFYRIPMTTHTPPTAAQIAEFLTIVTDPSNGSVYVHCQGGRHRTGVMTAIYRMTQDHWTADRAFAEMKQFKFGSDFLHPEFKRFVYSYDAKLERSPAQPVVATVTITK